MAQMSRRTFPTYLMALIALVALATPNASAALPSSGKYLDVNTNLVYTYDNVTGLLVPTGPSQAAQYECHTGVNSSVNYDRCGDCTYAPDDSFGHTGDGRGWESTSVYLYGWCVNVNATNPNWVDARLDIMAVNHTGESWYPVLFTTYYDASNNPVNTTSRNAGSPCNADSHATQCKGTVVSWDPTAINNLPPYDHYCVFAQVFNTAGATPHLVGEAHPCAFP